MSGPKNAYGTGPMRPPAQGLLIVARDQQNLYRTLQRAYRDTDEVLVLRDRRHGELRRSVQRVTGERRQRDRRCLSALADEFRVQSYVLVYPTDAGALASRPTAPRWHPSVVRALRDWWARRSGTTPDQ